MTALSRRSALISGVVSVAALTGAGTSYAATPTSSSAGVRRIRVGNAGRMRPPATPVLPAQIFICEFYDGRVALVDSGFSREDLNDPVGRLGAGSFAVQPDRSEEFTAIGQVKALGYNSDQVSDIVLTHLDLDHAGGLADFPGATCHVSLNEYKSAIIDRSVVDSARYRAPQLEMIRQLKVHPAFGDLWDFGLSGHEVLPGIVMIPMPGHTWGHCAVAVKTGSGAWAFHAGDSMFDSSQLTLGGGASIGGSAARLSVQAFEQTVAVDRRQVETNHSTLSKIASSNRAHVVLAHDERTAPVGGVFE